jgi:hypothetical protein
VYCIDKKTPRGVWIKHDGCNDYPGAFRKWVGDNHVKKYAHPTKEEALHSLKVRKRVQIEILTAQLDFAKRCEEYLSLIETPNDTSVQHDVVNHDALFGRM